MVFAGDDTTPDADRILSQNGRFSAVARESAGQYLVTMEPGSQLSASDCVRAGREEESTVTLATFLFAVERVSATQFRIRSSAAAGVATDQPRVTVSITSVLQG